MLHNRLELSSQRDRYLTKKRLHSPAPVTYRLDYTRDKHVIDVAAAARRYQESHRYSGAVCGFTGHWSSLSWWSHVSAGKNRRTSEAFTDFGETVQYFTVMINGRAKTWCFFEGHKTRSMNGKENQDISNWRISK